MPVTCTTLVRELSRLETAAISNQEQRRKHAKEPEKYVFALGGFGVSSPARFLESETRLNEQLRWFVGVGTAQVDVLQLLGSGDATVAKFYTMLLPLLSHPNSDIGNLVVAIVHELFHDDEGVGDPELLVIIAGMAMQCLEHDLLLFFHEHAMRLTNLGSGIDADDNQALFQMLEIVEDVLDLVHMERDEQHMVLFYDRLAASNLLALLVDMFKQDPKRVKETSMAALLSPGEYANRLYAAELCATLFQLSAADLLHHNPAISASIGQLWTMAVGGLVMTEAVLVALSPYRMRDPVDADEQEYMFNLFAILGALLLHSRDARESFASEHCEGFQLMLLMLKERNMARIRAIQIVDYALSLATDGSLAERFVASGGLKVLAPLLMGRGCDKLVRAYPKLLRSVDQDEGHVCAVLASLFKHTPLDSTAFFRILAKFAENEGERFGRLVELHCKYQERVTAFDQVHGTSRADETWLLDRMNAGLFVLQQVDLCLVLLANHVDILRRIRDNVAVTGEIEPELFEAVEREARAHLCLSDGVAGQARLTLMEMLQQLSDRSAPIYVALATFV